MDEAKSLPRREQAEAVSLKSLNDWKSESCIPFSNEINMPSNLRQTSGQHDINLAVAAFTFNQLRSGY